MPCPALPSPPAAMGKATVALGEEAPYPIKAAAVDEPAFSASFRDLLKLLLAKYDSLEAENQALRSQNASERVEEWHVPVEAPRPPAGGGGEEVTQQRRASEEISEGGGLFSTGSFEGGTASRGISKESSRRLRTPGKHGDHADDTLEQALGLEPEAARNGSKTPNGDDLDASSPDILDIWQAPVYAPSNLVSNPTPRPDGIEQELKRDFNSVFGDSTCLGRWLSRSIMRPESQKRMIWDTIGMLLLIFDVMHTPLMVFAEPSSVFELTMGVVTTVFWTCDIGVSFLRGYYSGCVLEMRPGAIALRYLKREFLPDLLIATLDWSMMIVETEASRAVGYSRITKAFRFVRIARILRLVRLVKVHQFMEILESSTMDFATLSLIHVSKNLVLIVGINHFIACGWYAIGSLSKPSWRDILDEESRDIAYRYATSLHWSITQFTPASMEIQPKNVYERAFSVLVIFIGLVMFSSFVSTITSTMTTFRVERNKRFKQKEFIRRYITENSISLALGSRISSFLSTYKFGSQRRVARNDIFLFKALPKNLRLMIDWEVYQGILIRVCFFAHVNECSPSGMLQICHIGVEEVSIASCEELFHCGKSASAMYITIAGSMQYFHGFDEGNPVDIHGRSRKRISEHALWLRWMHQGRIFSLTTCDFLSICAKKLAKALVHHPELVLAGQEHAKLYYSRMEAMKLSCCGEGENPNPRPSQASGEVAVDLSMVAETGEKWWFPNSDLFYLDHGIALELAQSAFARVSDGELLRHMSTKSSNSRIAKHKTVRRLPSNTSV